MWGLGKDTFYSLSWAITFFGKRRQKGTPHFLFSKKRQKEGLSLKYVGRSIVKHLLKI